MKTIFAGIILMMSVVAQAHDITPAATMINIQGALKAQVNNVDLLDTVAVVRPYIKLSRPMRTPIGETDRLYFDGYGPETHNYICESLGFGKAVQESISVRYVSVFETIQMNHGRLEMFKTLWSNTPGSMGSSVSAVETLYCLK